MRTLRRARRRAVLLAFLVTQFAGCQFYWGKTGATQAQFDNDSRECAKEAYAVASSGSDASQRIYRGCLRVRGWVREKHAAPGDGWYRGIEDWD
jgi:hypothetical protein